MRRQLPELAPEKGTLDGILIQRTEVAMYMRPLGEQFAKSDLLFLHAGSKDAPFHALVDSGASHNFMSVDIVCKYGWKPQWATVLSVQLADGTLTTIQGTVTGLTIIGPWMGMVTYQILDLHFEAVLEMLWLTIVNPLVDWANKTLSVNMLDQMQNLSAIGTYKPASVVTKAIALIEQVSLSILSAAKFARSLKKEDKVSMLLLEQLDGDLHFMHRAAYGDMVKGKVTSSEKMLNRLEQEFPKVFQPPTYPITSDRILFAIPLIDPAIPPARRKLYPLSEAQSVELKKQLAEILDCGRIVHSASPYGHPILFAQTKGGAGLRLCMEYRSLNANTVTDTQPLPRIDILLSRLRGATIFSKLDLRDGYHQVSPADQDQYKIAFAYKYGNFQYGVMTFGLKNAPAHFQSTMNMILRDILDTCVLVYLDDILIFSKSRAERDQYVRQVFERLQQCNFHIKRSKSELFLESVELLGHQVSKKMIEVTQYKAEAVASWPVLQNKCHIQKFFGLYNQFRLFIPKFAKVAQPMTDLTIKEVPFEWASACMEAFDHLKHSLHEAPVLAVYDPDLATEVQCDTSAYACCAVLVQKQDTGWRPVEYLLKRFNQAETNYNVIEREFMGFL